MTSGKPLTRVIEWCSRTTHHSITVNGSGDMGIGRAPVHLRWGASRGLPTLPMFPKHVPRSRL